MPKKTLQPILCCFPALSEEWLLAIQGTVKDSTLFATNKQVLFSYNHHSCGVNT